MARISLVCVLALALTGSGFLPAYADPPNDCTTGTADAKLKCLVPLFNKSEATVADLRSQISGLDTSIRALQLELRSLSLTVDGTGAGRRTKTP